MVEKIDELTEEESAKIARDFLKKHNVADTEIDGIVEIIGAKGMTYEPKPKLGGILRDVYSAHISSKNYEDYTSLLK